MLLPSLSQQHLQLWHTCRRKFRHTFLDDLNLPLNYELLAKLTLGKQFHLILQQHQLDIDVSTFIEPNSQLDQWFQSYLKHPPHLIAGEKFSEQQRSISLSQVIFTAVYDLVVIGQQSAQIIDWKTHQNPILPSILADHWQTKLYLFILQKTTNFAPEALSMTYWFANAQPSEKTVIISYSSALHQQIKRDLQETIEQMQQEQIYPHLPLESKTCQYCEFLHRCTDTVNRQNFTTIDLSAIPEVEV